MKPVCGNCGDTGWEEALICCFMCQDAYEHRYCFNKASDIFKKDVKFACEDCLPNIRTKKPSPKKIWNLPPRKSERLSTRNVPPLKAGFEARTVGEISLPSAKSAKQKNEISPGLTNSNGSTECKEKNREKDVQVPLKIEEQPSELIKESSSNPEDVKGYARGSLWIDLPVSSQVNDNTLLGKQGNCDLHAKPIMDPIWKGSLRISYKSISRVEGVAAHLSTLACPKAQQEASLLPVTLRPRTVPRSSVWPKSFEKTEPKDESIGLYFFPERDRYAEAFDSLVTNMIADDLAMVCAVENAELLVFTSMKLPFDYWRFQGKHYLWGVFRAKQTHP